MRVKLAIKCEFDGVKNFFGFIKSIPSFYRLYRNYPHWNGDDIENILGNYMMVICNSTSTMSKLNYDWRSVCNEIEDHYYRYYKEENKQSYHAAINDVIEMMCEDCKKSHCHKEECEYLSKLMELRDKYEDI